jgi:hypothetical protein
MCLQSKSWIKGKCLSERWKISSAHRVTIMSEEDDELEGEYDDDSDEGWDEDFDENE